MMVLRPTGEPTSGLQALIDYRDHLRLELDEVERLLAAAAEAPSPR